MDFSKTKLYQRTRSGYERLYLEFNEKKNNGRRLRGGDGGGLSSESGGVCVTARVGGDASKGKSSRKSSEVCDGGRIEVDAVSRRTRQALRGKKKSGMLLKKGKSSKQVHVIDESENDADGGGGGHINSGIEEASESEKIEKTLRRGRSQNRGKTNQNIHQLGGDGVELSKSNGKNQSKFNAKGTSGIGKNTKDNKSSRTKDLLQNEADDVDYALSYLGDAYALKSAYCCSSGNAENDLETGVLNNTTVSNDDSLKEKGGSGDEFEKEPKASSFSSGGFLLGESDEDDNDGVMYLGDDVACLEDYDPSHSSRVESNEIKMSPVELESVQADADAKLQGQKSSEEEDDDPQKLVSPEEDGSDLQDIQPVENNAAAEGKEVISLSSSSDSEDDVKDGNAIDVDASNASEIENNDDLCDKFWYELLQMHMSEEGKKNKKSNILKPPVSKKHCGNSNEMQKPIEAKSKKRRIDADSSLGFGGNKSNINKVEENFWQVIDEKVTEESWKSTSKKYDQFRNKINVMEVLTDAIREEGDGDMLLKKYVDVPQEENPTEKRHVDEIQSYKFKFEDEEDMKPQKIESEMEVDELFDEMNMCLQLSEIGYSGTSGAKRVDAGFLVEGTHQATCCRQGKHQLTINEEFGIICRYCSYVEMEIREILPPLSKNGRGGQSRQEHDKADNTKFSDLKLADCHKERHLDSKGSECEKGTVWDLVPGVKESMYPHQRDGFEFIWNKIAGGTYIDKLEKRLPTGGSGCIISHAPGTGKSRLTIVFLQAFLKMYPSSRPLIIAPRSMLLTWEEEFKKWNVDFPFFNLNNAEFSGQEHKIAVTLIKQFGSPKSPRQLRFLKLFSWKKTPSVLGITYRLFENLAGEEGKRKRAVNNVEDEQMKKFLLQVPTLLVLDEGHTPRNDQSNMWKTLLNVKTKRSIILSGTPFQNNFDELYNTLCLVNPLLSFGISSLNSVEFSKKRGWKHNSTKGQWDSLTSSIKKNQHKLEELRAMIDPFVHVHKGTILQDRLPGLRDALVVLKPTKTQQTLLGKMSGLKPTLENDHVMSLVSVHPSLLPKSAGNELFHKMLKVFKNDPRAGVKTHFLMELIKLSLAHNEKVLVFSQYIKPLEFIMQLLKTYFRWVEGRECLYMDGQQEEKHRQTSINTLNDPKSAVRVLLASLRACSEGINLVGASRVVLLDVHWNPSVERQAISRAYRLGQKKLVHVYHLVTGSMEGEKYIRQVEKSHLSELVFSSKNKDSFNPKISSTVLKDNILEEMVQHEMLQGMFEKVIYQPKEADLIDTFG
ncbi:hypothetical protein R6Q59_032085 [Mikania micrantha]